MQPATSQPRRIAQYELTETLAQQGKVRLYRAFDPASKRSVALRTIANDARDGEIARFISRFQKQAQVSAGLKHPGIIEVYEFGEDSGVAFLATELVEGCTLKTRLRVPMPDACSLMIQLLSALEYAHSKRVLHLNLLPASLVLTSKGQLKLADFGGPDGGAPDSAYRAPEQVMGATIDQRSDIFSAGVFFYELLAGTAPFPGPVEKLTDQICRMPEAPVSQANPSLPRAFDPVCAKSLAKAAEERYSGAREFAEEIRMAYESASGTSPRELVSNETAVSAFLTSLRGESKKSRSYSTQAKSDSKVPSASADSPWPLETVRTVERQLAAFIGPLARVVVKEAAAKTTELSTLYELAAESLASPEDRAAFLAKQPGGRRTDSPDEPGSDSAETATFPDVRLRMVPADRPASQPRPMLDRAMEPVVLRPAEQSKSASGAASAPNLNPESKSAGDDVKPISKEAGQNQASPAPELDIVARLEDLLGKQPETLAGYLTEDPPEVDQVIFAFISSAEALVRLYEAKGKTDGLGPQNIEFDRLGKATIRVSTTTTYQGTILGGPVGSPRYAAPEIFADKGVAGDAAAADIYSLGFMFYEILLGRKLFRALFPGQRTDLDWLRWHADTKKKVPSLKSQIPNRPAALSELLESMMEKDAAQRAKDPAAIIARLKAVAQQASRTLVSRKPSAFPSIVSDTDTPDTPVLAQSQVRSGGNRILIVMAIVLILGILGLVALQNADRIREFFSPSSQTAPAGNTQ